MEILTPKAVRRSTRLRVEIPVSVTSLDRMHPFAEKCVAIVVSCQGCGIRSSRALAAETPILLSDLPGGGSVTARVASCLPLGPGEADFLIGASLYTHGNVWGIVDPPEDWNTTPQPAADSVPDGNGPQVSHRHASKQPWPYNVFATSNQTHLAKK